MRIGFWKYLQQPKVCYWHSTFIYFIFLVVRKVVLILFCSIFIYGFFFIVLSLSISHVQCQLNCFSKACGFLICFIFEVTCVLAYSHLWQTLFTFQNVKKKKKLNTILYASFDILIPAWFVHEMVVLFHEQYKERLYCICGFKSP